MASASKKKPQDVIFLRCFGGDGGAQLLYNSAGQLVLGNAVLLGCLIISACCSTVASNCIGRQMCPA